MKKKIDFLIFYEHKNREFESIVLLKHELVKRGYTVEFFSFYETHNWKKRKNLFNNVRIAVMPSLYHDENILNCVYSVAGKVKNIVNLRWEQLFSIKTENNLDYYVFPKENANNGYHLCWGQKPYDMLHEAGVDISKLFITGPIHLDFLRTSFSGYYLNKRDLFQKYGIDDSKDCILFTSSFSLSSLDERCLESFLSQFDTDEREYYNDFLVRELNSKRIIIEWFIQLAERENCTVIYRPHPAEANTEIIEQLKTKTNIKVLSDYNIKQWILACDQVYTWYSTSIVEASVAGVPCAVLRPVELIPDDEIPIYEDFQFITNYQQLIDCYKNNKSSSMHQYVQNDKLAEYISIDSQKPSYIRTADVLEQALKDDYHFPWKNFSEDALSTADKQMKNQYRKDVWARIIVKPFYDYYFTNRVISRVFPKLYYQYCGIAGIKERIIPDKEFDEMENRIDTVLRKNQNI